MPKSTKTSDAAPKSSAKPRKTAARKTNLLQMETPKFVTEAPDSHAESHKSISHEQVAELAHRFWNERGRVHGHDVEDWYRAEELLRGKAS